MAEQESEIPKGGRTKGKKTPPPTTKGVRQNQDILDTAQAAKVLGIEETTLARYLRDGIVPGRKVGTQWRLSHDQLVRFIEDGGDTKKPE